MVTLEENREQIPAITTFVQSEIDAEHTPGAAIGIMVQGEIIFAGGFGQRDRAQGLPVDTDTLFAIGSCTKAFTSFGVGLLVDEGKTTWDTRIRDVLPEFRLYDSVATEYANFRDLLGHRTGLPRHDAMWYGSQACREELVSRLRYLKPSATFRERWQYQNLMFMTAGYAVGKLAGTPWEDFTQQRIFDPLGMTRSNLSVRVSEAAENAARPYSYRGGSFVDIPFRNIDAVGPAGSINSNIDDMLKWLHVHLKGKPDLIKEETRRELYAPQMVIPEMPDLPWAGSSEVAHTSYALGWATSSYRGHSMLRHNGGIDGFNSSVAILPHQDIGVVVLCNTAEREPAGAIMFGIVDRLLGLEPVLWWDRFEGVAAKGRASLEAYKQKLMAERQVDAKPSHALEAYTGIYYHPGYGDMTISLDGDRLCGVYGGLTLRLTPHHYDLFRVEIDNEDQFFVSSFSNDDGGKVSRLTCQLEPALDPIEFTRKADA
ncbi:MAG: serine hydrolase [Chloroflexi bacterium]|nr:serine hydrolase [Chloroflexota bacterium]